jgi:phosphoglycerol transferase MdoB-like AlkP superfamily enzyme
MFGGNGGWYPNYQTLNKIKYLSLTKLLNQQGYETIFIDSHRKDAAYVDDMMQKLDFQEVLTAEKLSKDYLNGDTPAHGDALSDTQLYESLTRLLTKKAEEERSEKPFFIGLYNYGTHSWVNVTDDEVHFGNGWNPTLNTIHNLDAAFGKFWSYFQHSPYAENTIIIFTTDHCHYPTQPFVAAINDPGYQRIFVDRIPLIIHDPQRNLPPRFDAGNSTSLDFTPSLIHYLGLKNQPNPFLGRSIFSQKERPVHLGVSVIEPEIFIIDGNRIHNEKNSTLYRQDLLLLKKFLHISHALELSDKLWHE